jgi:hypothetical protein
LPSTIVLQTFLSLEECRARLAEACDEEQFTFLSQSGYRGTMPILGKIRGDSFRLQYRIFYRNPNRPFFYGRFIPCEEGTRIEGEFRMHPLVKWSSNSWCAFVLLFLVIAVADLIRDKGRFSDHGLPFLVPVGMLAFMFALTKFGQWLARGHQRIIIEFLKKSLSAELKTH